MSQAALTAIVSGRVQMVMYRDFAARKARMLDITGEVQNLPDGTVRIAAEGEKEALIQYIERLKKGPLLARVKNVSVVWQEPTGVFKSFSIQY